MGDQKKNIKIRVGADIQPFSISSRIPDIETIQLDIQQYNVLYYTTKIPVIPDIRPNPN